MIWPPLPFAHVELAGRQRNASGRIGQIHPVPGRRVHQQELAVQADECDRERRLLHVVGASVQLHRDVAAAQLDHGTILTVVGGDHREFSAW